MILPASTYRVQLHERFNFSQLQEIIDYLHELGISSIYASPITRAIKGSRHGYDVTDPQAISTHPVEPSAALTISQMRIASTAPASQPP